jgi:hypothetical protein
MIRKALLYIAILFDDEVVEPEFFQEATPSDLERLMDDEAVGISCLESITPVRRQDLEQELLALGNDGSFFDPSEDQEN